MASYDGLPCNDCLYDVKGCCDYNEPLGRACILGSAYKPKPLAQISIDEYLKQIQEGG